MGLFSKIKKVVTKGPVSPKAILKNPNAALQPIATLSPLGNKDPVSKLLGLTPQPQGGGAGGPPAPSPNPFAGIAGNFIPGIGYQGGNVFGNVMSQIPQGFFNNPQAAQMLAQILGPQGMPQPPPQQPRPYIAPWATPQGPGPAMDAATLFGQVGGLGNGGGKMAPMAQRPWK